MLVLGKSLMVISTIGILLQLCKVYPFYNVLQESMDMLLRYFALPCLVLYDLNPCLRNCLGSSAECLPSF